MGVKKIRTSRWFCPINVLRILNLFVMRITSWCKPTEVCQADLLSTTGHEHHHFLWGVHEARPQLVPLPDNIIIHTGPAFFHGWRCIDRREVCYRAHHAEGRRHWHRRARLCCRPKLTLQSEGWEALERLMPRLSRKGCMEIGWRSRGDLRRQIKAASHINCGGLSSHRKKKDLRRQRLPRILTAAADFRVKQKREIFAHQLRGRIGISNKKKERKGLDK